MFSIDKKDLCGALAVLRARPSSGIPIFGLVTFGRSVDIETASLHHISLDAVDMEWSARVMVPAVFQQPFRLGEPVGLDSDDLLHLSRGKGRITFVPDAKAGRTAAEAGDVWADLSQHREPAKDANGKVLLPFSGPSEVPRGQSKVLAVEAGALADVLELVVKASSTEQTRYYLNGVAAEAGAGPSAPFMDITATDGHRMVTAPLRTISSSAGWPATIIPRATIPRLCAFLRLVGGEVSLSADDNRVTVRTGSSDSIFTLRAIDGTFPAWQRVIPKFDASRTYQFDHAQFVTALNRVKRSVRYRGECLIEFDPTFIRLHVPFRNERCAERTMIRTQIPAVPATRSPLGRKPRGCNFNYLRSIAAMLTGSATISATIGQDGDPMLFSGSNGVRAVLMPMRVNQDDFGIAPGWE
jgi:hypothetical protein